MSCCGKHRLAGAPAPRPALPSASTQPAAKLRVSHVFFEYVGPTALTVVGPSSGRRYRFEASGSRQPVEPVDRAGLAAIPHLRQVAAP
jgi:hypothetical protein